MYPPANNGQRSLGFSGFSREGFWTDASAGDQYTLALRADGDVDCFGDNANKCAPKKGKKGPFVAVSAGGVIAVALKPGGGVEHWWRCRQRVEQSRRWLVNDCDVLRKICQMNLLSLRANTIIAVSLQLL